MAGLNDIIQQTTQAAKLQVRGVKNEVRQGVQGAISNARNQVVTGATSVVRAVVNGGVNTVISAGTELVKGNVEGAIDAVTGGASSIVDRVSSISGINISGALGLTSSSGYDSGIDPGNPLAGAMARPDPIMSYDWYTEMPLIQPPVGAAQALPWYYVEEINLPTRQIGVRSIFREGRDRHYPDKYSVDPLRVSIYADNSNVALNYITAWNSLVINPTTTQNAYLYGGGYGQPSKHNRSIKTFILSANKTTLVEFEYTECWPTGMEAVNLQSAASERIVWHVTFSVGDVFAKIYDVSNSLNTGIMGDGPSLAQQSIQQVVGRVYSQASNFVVSNVRGAINNAISLF